MDFKVISERRNQLLSRRELKIEAGHAGAATPSRPSLQKLIASQLSVDESLVIVDRIFTSFGSAACKADVKIYDTVVPKEKLARMENRAKKGGAPKAEKKTEEKK